MDPDQTALGPRLANEKAEPRPDMNITVAAFTVSEKYINTVFGLNSVCFIYSLTHMQS